MRLIAGIRRGRAGLWLAGLAVIAVIAATISLTGPAVLVWWTSPPLRSTGSHVRLLIPQGWERIKVAVHEDASTPLWNVDYLIRQVDRRPQFIRWIIPFKPEDGYVVVMVYRPELSGGDLGTGIRTSQYHNQHIASKHLAGSGMWVSLHYARTNRRAFDDTYETICNSLTIE